MPFTLRRHTPEGKIHVYMDDYAAICGDTWSIHFSWAGDGPTEDVTPLCKRCEKGLKKVAATVAAFLSEMSTLLSKNADMNHDKDEGEPCPKCTSERRCHSCRTALNVLA